MGLELRRSGLNDEENPFAVKELVVSDAGAVRGRDASPLDWIDTLYTATGPFSVAPEESIRQLKLVPVSGANLVEMWGEHARRSFVARKYGESGLQFARLQYFQTAFLKCVLNRCEDDWALDSEHIDEVATFVESEDEKKCIQALLVQIRTAGPQKQVPPHVES